MYAPVSSCVYVCPDEFMCICLPRYCCTCTSHSDLKSSHG